MQNEQQAIRVDLLIQTLEQQRNDAMSNNARLTAQNMDLRAQLANTLRRMAQLEAEKAARAAPTVNVSTEGQTGGITAQEIVDA